MFKMFSMLFQMVHQFCYAGERSATALAHLAEAGEEEALAFRKNLAIESEARTKRLAAELKKDRKALEAA